MMPAAWAAAEAFRDLPHDGRGERQRQRPGATDELRQDLAVGPLEREVVDAAGVFAELVSLHHDRCA